MPSQKEIYDYGRKILLDLIEEFEELKGGVKSHYREEYEN